MEHDDDYDDGDEILGLGGVKSDDEGEMHELHAQHGRLDDSVLHVIPSQEEKIINGDASVEKSELEHLIKNFQSNAYQLPKKKL